MKIVVTGAHGFLGWHLRARLHATSPAADVVAIGRIEMRDRDLLTRELEDADVLMHVAGANRGDQADVAATNIELAHQVVDAVDRSGGQPDIVFANSTQSQTTTSYGFSKAAAAAALAAGAAQTGSQFVDVVLPNLFGEHGRPAYNSFVATFCHELLAGRQPSVNDPAAEVELLHVQDAAQAMIDAITSGLDRVRPVGTVSTVGEVRDLLTAMHRVYRGSDLPLLQNDLEQRLFSTYRSAGFPAGVPVELPTRSDDRGSLVEAVRTRAGAGQTFVSTTLPGQVRGDHFHLHKLERFLVLKGTAEIRLRRVLHDDVLRFKVSGDVPAFVDMPVLWSHAIENVGDDELVTLFWTDELFDADRTDTYREVVAPAIGDAR